MNNLRLILIDTDPSDTLKMGDSTALMTISPIGNGKLEEDLTLVDGEGCTEHTQLIVTTDLTTPVSGVKVRRDTLIEGNANVLAHWVKEHETYPGSVQLSVLPLEEDFTYGMTEDGYLDLFTAVPFCAALLQGKEVHTGESDTVIIERPDGLKVKAVITGPVSQDFFLSELEASIIRELNVSDDETVDSAEAVGGMAQVTALGLFALGLR